MLTKILIFLIKTLLLIKKIVVFIINIVKKIIMAILNFLFFKILIKLYYNYILIYKKVKEINKKNNSKLYLIKKNAPIFIIIILVSTFVLTNNIQKTKAQSLPDQIYKTTLAKNIESDFEESNNEELIIETLEDNNLENIVSNQYLNQIGLLKTKTKVSKNSEEDYAVVSEHGDLLSNNGLNTSEATTTRNKIIEYAVQSGDTVSSIASNFGLNVNTILWENNLSSNSLIKPGAKLTILPTNGIRHTVAKNENIGKIATKYGVTAEIIIDGNDMEEGESLKIGQKLFIPGGKKIVENTTIVNRTYAGTTITQNTNSNQKPAYTGGKLLWPTVGARITQYYSWSHKGLDIANKTGTPLYAAEDGTVERSGWSNGYGYNVIINHGGGLKTLYGHASKLYVKAGDTVSRGEVIAAMGSTGWSTGPHIHFEVRVNGVQQNPLNYIK